MHLDLEEIDNVDGLGAIADEWRELWRSDTCATPFQAPEWLLPWTKWIWGGGKLRVWTIRSGRRLVGLAPLFLWGFGTRPEVVRVSFLGAGISDYLGIIAEPGFAAQTAHLILEQLAACRGEWQLCDLQELRPCSPLLRAETPAGLDARESTASVCAGLTLPEDMEELLAARTTGFRRNLRHSGKTLRSQGEVRFLEAAPGESGMLMQDLFRLHSARWLERQEQGMFATARLTSFHLDAAARLAASGMLRLYGLEVKGGCIAVQYNFLAKEREYYYLSGFDPEWRKFSPGGVLIEHAIRRAIETGVREIDFLRQREAFKYDWGARDHTNCRLLLTHSAEAASEVA